MSNLSEFFPSGSPKTWVSGTTYATGTVVLSPAAKYAPYVRITNGAGTTDPALDGSNYKAFGSRPAKALFGASGTTAADAPTAGSPGWREANNVRLVLSGATTSGVYKDVITVTGGGELSFCALENRYPSPLDCALKITIDGVNVCERSISSLGVNSLIIGVGSVDMSVENGAICMQPIPFHASLVVALRANAYISDPVGAIVNYMVN